MNGYEMVLKAIGLMDLDLQTTWTENTAEVLKLHTQIKQMPISSRLRAEYDRKYQAWYHRTD